MFEARRGKGLVENRSVVVVDCDIEIADCWFASLDEGKQFLDIVKRIIKRDGTIQDG